MRIQPIILLQWKKKKKKNREVTQDHTYRPQPRSAPSSNSFSYYYGNGIRDEAQVKEVLDGDDYNYG